MGERGEDYRRELKGERESKRENNRFLIEFSECLNRREISLYSLSESAAIEDHSLLTNYFVLLGHLAS